VVVSYPFLPPAREYVTVDYDMYSDPTRCSPDFPHLHRMTLLGVQTELARLEKAHRANLENLAEADLEPVGLVRDNGALVGAPNCSDYFVEDATDGLATTTVISFDMNKATPPVLANVVSPPGAVYVSDQSLYVAARHDSSEQSSWHAAGLGAEVTNVHRFRVGADIGATGYHSSGRIPGHVLNQFGMDEYQGDLRVATSVGSVPEPDVISVVSVLREKGSDLELVGQLAGIAPNEDIRSVRF